MNSKFTNWSEIGPRPTTIGFDSILSDLFASPHTAFSYPPYNLVKGESDDHFLVELAVAGFSEDEIAVSQTQNALTIVGSHKDTDDGREYAHHGLAGRNFTRAFKLASHVYVKKAQLKNGILSIWLERELPEEMKPRTIEVQTGSGG